MNAELTLSLVARAFHTASLEAVMIGNAAAALQGAPVTTLDIDFMFRPTRRNVDKLKQVADLLHGVILRPYYPISDLYRLTVDDSALQLDFLAVAHGIPSFASLRSRATRQEYGGHPLLVASLEDIVRSKRAMNRPKDQAVLHVLERTLHEKQQAAPQPPPAP